MSNVNKYQVVNYSEKAIAVFFEDTRQAVIQGYDEFLVTLGGKKNPSLKGVNPADARREGYIFSIKRKAEIENALKAFVYTPTPTATPVATPVAQAKVAPPPPSTPSTTSSEVEKIVHMLSSRVEALEMQVDALQRLMTDRGMTIAAAHPERKTKQVKKSHAPIGEDDEDMEDDTEQKEPVATPSLIIRRK